MNIAQLKTFDKGFWERREAGDYRGLIWEIEGYDNFLHKADRIQPIA